MATPDDGFQKDIENELMCPVCLKLYDKPCRLDCQHAFCQRCLQKIVKSDSVVVVCPACRAATSLRLPGFLGIAKLPQDLQLSRLVEKYRQRHGASDNESDSDDGGHVGVRNALGGSSDALHTDPHATAFEQVDAPSCCEVLHGYIPFDIPPDRTFHLFSDWTTKLWLCPTDFSRKARLKTPLRKVAIPFYVYSVKTQVDFKAKVVCPQDGRTSLPTCKMSTQIRRDRVSAPILRTNADPCANHESRRWLQSAVGSTVTHITSRDSSKGLDQGWGTWLWQAARPVLSPVLAGVGMSGYPQLALGAPPGCGAASSSGCQAAPTSSSSHAPPSPRGCAAAPCGPADDSAALSCRSDRCSSASDGPPACTPAETVDNMESGAKVGQTYVSSTQPMQRHLTLTGKHSNYFNNMLVCASYGVDEDLVATLMTGYSKENDLTLMKPIKVDPPMKQRTHEYLRKVTTLMDDDEGTLSGERVRKPRSRPQDGEADDDDGLFGPQPAGQHGRRRSRRRVGGAADDKRAEDPSKAYDELLRAPTVATARDPPVTASSSALDDFFDSPKLTPDVGGGSAFAGAASDAGNSGAGVGAEGGWSVGDWDTAPPPLSQPVAGSSDQALQAAGASSENLRTLSMLPEAVKEEVRQNLRTLSSYSPPPLFEPARPSGGWGSSSKLDDPVVNTPLEILHTTGGSRLGGNDPMLTPTSNSDIEEEVPEQPTATRLVDAVTVEQEDYFSLANAPVDDTTEQTNASYTDLEVLPPERTAEDAWLEHVWPHTQEKEVEFTKSVINSLEPRGAVVESSEIELTVTELKQKAVLIPCYVATYEYDDREYNVLLHGRTGEVHGKRPWIGSATYDTMKRNMGGQMSSVRNYVEETLDHLGVG